MSDNQEINFIEQLNIFVTLSAGALNSYEQAIYFRLFMIDNRLRWENWFPVSDAQLMNECKIGSHHTIINSVKKLETSGLIKTKRKRRKLTKYKICKLNATARGAVEEKTTARGAVETTARGAVNYGTRCRKLRHEVPTIINKTKQDDVEGDEEKNDCVKSAKEKDLADVYSLFQNNIHPLSGEIEADYLEDLLKEYGREWMLEAIKIAALNHGLSVRYIQRVLERWKKNGFKSSPGKKEGRKADGRKQRAGNKPESVVMRAVKKHADDLKAIESLSDEEYAKRSYELWRERNPDGFPDSRNRNPRSRN